MLSLVSLKADFRQNTMDTLLANWVIVLDELFKIYPAQADQANKEALQFTLGDDCNLDLDVLIKERLKK